MTTIESIKTKYNLTDEDIAKNKDKYRRQIIYIKNRVDRNGNPIKMDLTFVEWLTIWLESGKLHLRGQGIGSYVMGRHNDLGDYAVGNVSIISQEENCYLAGKHAKSEETKARMKVAAKVRGEKEGYREMMSAATKGRTFSQEHRDAISESAKKRTPHKPGSRSEEAKANIRAGILAARERKLANLKTPAV